jgi:hypothetical protein
MRYFSGYLDPTVTAADALQIALQKCRERSLSPLDPPSLRNERGFA